MLNFSPVSLEDKDRLRSLLLAAPDRGCEYTFGNIYIWSTVSKINVAWHSGGAIIHFEQNPNCYLFPIGVGDLKSALEDIFCDCTARGCCCRIIAASADDCRAAEQLFPGYFNFHESRDFAEYVYSAQDLMTLAGKKFHGKRNHISRFEQENEWEFREIKTPADLDAIAEFNERWFAQRDNPDEGLLQEHLAASAAIKNFFELDFKGGYITTPNGIVAFSLGEPINDKTFCVHIEKADGAVVGAYAIINREFARAFCQDYQYINREDDAGEEGLRKAKLSYNPVLITQKYVIHKED